MSAKLQENIHVVIRFRPTNKREKKEAKKLKIKDKPIIFQNNDEKRIGAIEICPIKSNEPLRFTFDRILDHNTSQEAAFNYAAEQTCNEVLAGYNGCLFCYGQTGSGKTYTMFGPEDGEGDPRLMGIIPRSTSYIFSEIEDDPHIIEAKVKVSFVEIYKEKLRDLLNPSSKKQLKIRLNKSGETEIVGVTETLVMSLIDVLKLIDCANQYRTKAATTMNQSSSRSHMLMVLTVACKVNDSSIRVGKLNLVDLAGSEKVRKTGVKGQRLKEAQKINLSLTMLGQVISALSEKRKHIPFRDSKLTHVLKDSLGGNCKTTIVINASKHMFNRDETIISLRFGSRCKMITNEVKVNKIYSNNELLVMINQLRTENTQLKLDLQNATSISEQVPIGGRSASYSLSESSTFADMDVSSNKLFDKKNKKYEKYQQQIEELENKMNELEEENDGLKTANIQLIEENNKVIECDKCTTKSATIAEYEKKEKESQRKEKELIEFKNNINSLEDQNEELRLEIKSYSHENKEYKTKLEDIRKQQHLKTETLNAELEKFKELSEDQSGVTNELMNKIQKLKQGAVNSEAIINAQDKQLKSHDIQMNQFEKTIMVKDKKILNYENEIKNMQEKLDEFEELMNKLKADHDVVITDKNDEINSLDDEIHAKDEEISGKDDEIEQLKIELENRTQKLMEENHKLAQEIADNAPEMDIVKEEENVVVEENENDESKDELAFDDVYSFTFNSRPIGITFEHTPDKKNIRVTGVENDSAAKGKVFVESTVYKFQDEVVENIGAKYVYKAYKKRYATILPLTITFRKSDGYYDGYREGDKGDPHNEQVSVEQIVKAATRLSGIHKKPLISESEMKQINDSVNENDDIPTTSMMTRQTSVFDSAEYLNRVEVERKIRRQTIIENQNGSMNNKNTLGPMTDTRNRFSLFKKMKTPMDLLGEKKNIQKNISKKEKELRSIRKMSLPNNPGKRMNILINMATIEDDITILKRKLEDVNKSIDKKNKKHKKDEVDVDVAIYQDVIYGNKQPMNQLHKHKSISKVTSITGLATNADIALQFSDTVYPDFEEEDDDDEDTKEESESDRQLINELAVKLKSGVEIKDRKYLFSTYERCFIGKQAVTFMMKNSICKSRQEGVNLGKMLLTENVIRCVGKHNNFKDEKVFYRFLSDQRHIEI